ncbi:hypothetical protein ACFRMQ_01095 [Kitasatospora sp. NPDC056783]|uniref:hypothetical protein n=1 Tax=Kitasatospora sp. NPDC056783 TaxID=3345943 RepID=UPI00367CD717
MTARHPIRVPAALTTSLAGEAWRTWTDALPDLAEDFFHRWDLRLDGSAAHGVVALALPVRRPDGSAALLKLQPVDEETRGEPLLLAHLIAVPAPPGLPRPADIAQAMIDRLPASRPSKTKGIQQPGTTVF